MNINSARELIIRKYGLKIISWNSWKFREKIKTNKLKNAAKKVININDSNGIPIEAELPHNFCSFLIYKSSSDIFSLVEKKVL